MRFYIIIDYDQSLQTWDPFSACTTLVPQPGLINMTTRQIALTHSPHNIMLYLRQIETAILINRNGHWHAHQRASFVTSLDYSTPTPFPGLVYKMCFERANCIILHTDMDVYATVVFVILSFQLVCAEGKSVCIISRSSHAISLDWRCRQCISQLVDTLNTEA